MTAGGLPARAGRRLAAALALSLAALSVAGCWVEEADRAELEETQTGPGLDARVRSMLEASAAGWNRGDLDAFMEVYKEDSQTTYVGGTGLRRGYEAIRQRYEPLFGSDADRDSLRFEDLTVRRVADDVAVGVARWVLHRGGEVTGAGPFTLVLQRTTGGWKIVHDHSSSDPEAEEGEAAEEQEESSGGSGAPPAGEEGG